MHQSFLPIYSHILWKSLKICSLPLIYKLYTNIFRSVSHSDLIFASSVLQLPLCLLTSPLLLPYTPYWYHAQFFPSPFLSWPPFPAFMSFVSSFIGHTLLSASHFLSFCDFSLCHMLFSSVWMCLMPVGSWLRMPHVLLCVSRAHSLLLQPSLLEDGTTHIEVSSSDVNLIYTHSRVQWKQHLYVHTSHTHTHRQQHLLACD